MIWIFIIVATLVALYIFNKWNMRPVHWEPEEVVSLLESWIDGEVDYKRWDYFESCEISDSRLEAVRQQAIEATYINSPYIEFCGLPRERLNEKGRKLFRGLKAQCLKVAQYG